MMAGYENYQNQAAEIEKELSWRLQLLHVDWKNDAELELLAREALAFKAPGDSITNSASGDSDGRVRIEVFGLISLMWASIENGANEGQKIEAGDLWHRLSDALLAQR
jgi:hypothetical protein